jgi:hypothetical protein
MQAGIKTPETYTGIKYQQKEQTGWKIYNQNLRRIFLKIN